MRAISKNTKKGPRKEKRKGDSTESDPVISEPTGDKNRREERKTRGIRCGRSMAFGNASRSTGNRGNGPEIADGDALAVPERRG